MDEDRVLCTPTRGPDLETAYALTEMLEAACRVVWQARQIGELKRIPPGTQPELAQIRAQLRRRGQVAS